MAVVLVDIPVHNPPICGQTGNRIYLLFSRDFEMLGDGDTAHRVCPEGDGNINISVSQEIGAGCLKNYRYKCDRCGFLSIEH